MAATLRTESFNGTSNKRIKGSQYTAHAVRFPNIRHTFQTQKATIENLKNALCRKFAVYKMKLASEITAAATTN